MRRTIEPPPQRRSLIPWAFPAAMAPVIAANALLIYWAVASAPGIVTKHPFESGQAYQQDIAAAAAQRALGWSGALSAPAWAGTAETVLFTVADRAGAPVGGLSVRLRVWRPAAGEADLRARLAETAPGRYAARLTLPKPGQWQFDLLARRGAEEYALGRRIVVK